MDNSKYPQIEDMFSREDLEKEPYEITAFDSTYVILPGVFSPKIRNNSLWYAEKVLTLLNGRSFLEIGAGAGILAVEAAKRGYRVVATDIDSQAIQNIKLNAAEHNREVDIRKGNVFEPIQKDERFDTIFWNHPWMYSEEIVDHRHSVSFDYRYQSLERFISEGKFHLTKNGQILLGTGSLARIDQITHLANNLDYIMERIYSEVKPLSVGGTCTAEFLVYSLRPKARQ